MKGHYTDIANITPLTDHVVVIIFIDGVSKNDTVLVVIFKL